LGFLSRFKQILVQPLKLNGKKGKPLADVVMEFATNPLSFNLLCLHEPTGDVAQTPLRSSQLLLRSFLLAYVLHHSNHQRSCSVPSIQQRNTYVTPNLRSAFSNEALVEFVVVDPPRAKLLEKGPFLLLVFWMRKR
jgi:hypothetical protein